MPIFGSVEEFEPWLRQRPAPWGHVIAVRSALRCIPLLARYQRDDRSRFVFLSFRAVVLAWTTARLQVASNELLEFAGKAAEFLSPVAAAADLPILQRCAEAASYFFAGWGHDTSRAGRCAQYVIEFAADTLLLGGIKSPLLEEASVDAEALLRGRSPRSLVAQPLWSKDRPRWFEREWSDLARR